MGLLKFLIIAICVLYIIRMLARIFLPFLFKKAVHKMKEKMSQQQQAYQQTNNPEKPEGTLSVDFVPPTPKKKPKLDQAGDFVDYEDLK
jgi:flagellar basal body-associated protein FliL